MIIIITTFFKSQIILAETLNQINQIKSIKCWFFRRRENRSTRRKTSRSRVENQQTQSTYDTGSRTRTGTHWWKASALTTAPTLLPYSHYDFQRLHFREEKLQEENYSHYDFQFQCVYTRRFQVENLNPFYKHFKKKLKQNKKTFNAYE